ncbi:MAG: 3-carboxymuconate cyclase [Spirochaetales bacterium]|nr:3-carboxymuconate cyclase [Spirochaetales bacterium]
MDVYIGTYTKDSNSEGIYRASFDPSAGTLELKGLAATIENPSFMVLDSQKPVLYSVAEEHEGMVVSLKILDDGTLSELSRVPSGGSSACHLATAFLGRQVLAANYLSGTVSSMKVSEDGIIDPQVHTVQHKGSSVNPNRQEGPHAHSVNVDPEGKRVLVADLGVDRVITYLMDEETAELSAENQHSGAVAPGSGPRHMAYHPNGSIVYCVNELSSTVTVFAYRPGSRLDAVQTVSALPADFQGESHSADIHVHPSGGFVYSSNRGDDSIAIFRISEASGKLGFVGVVSTEGRTPRNFAVTPDGRYILAANQDSDNIVVLSLDENGMPAPTGCEVNVPKPVCVLLRE